MCQLDASPWVPVVAKQTQPAAVWPALFLFQSAVIGGPNNKSREALNQIIVILDVVAVVVVVSTGCDRFCS